MYVWERFLSRFFQLTAQSPKVEISCKRETQLTLLQVSSLDDSNDQLSWERSECLAPDALTCQWYFWASSFLSKRQPSDQWLGSHFGHLASCLPTPWRGPGCLRYSCRLFPGGPSESCGLSCGTPFHFRRPQLLWALQGGRPACSGSSWRGWRCGGTCRCTCFASCTASHACHSPSPCARCHGSPARPGRIDASYGKKCEHRGQVCSLLAGRPKSLKCTYRDHLHYLRKPLASSESWPSCGMDEPFGWRKLLKVIESEDK